jgi:hypothetical protein
MQEGIIAKAKGALDKRKEKKEKIKNAKQRVLDARDKVIDAKASFDKAKIALKKIKSEGIEIPEDIKTEDGGDFVYAAAQAKKEGKKKFTFQGKEYPVTIKTDIEESTNSESAFKLLITALKRKGLPTPKISKSSFTIPETDIKVTVDENVIDIFNGGKNPIKSFWPPLKLTYKQAADYIEEVFFDESTDKNMKEEIEIPKDIKKEDGGDFVFAAAQAKKDGKKKFTFQGKEYPVTIKTDIDESIDGRTKLFKEKCKALGYGKGNNGKDMKEIEEELSKKLIGESSSLNEAKKEFKKGQKVKDEDGETGVITDVYPVGKGSTKHWIYVVKLNKDGVEYEYEDGEIMKESSSLNEAKIAVNVDALDPKVLQDFKLIFRTLKYFPRHGGKAAAISGPDKMVKKALKHPDFWNISDPDAFIAASKNESIIGESSLNEKKLTVDVDWVPDNEGQAQSLLKTFNLKFKQTGNTTADITGDAKNIIKWMNKAGYEDIEELYPQLFEASLEEAAGIAPMKELEQAWIRTDGDKVKQAKLIKKHNLLPVFSSVRPGSIKLGIMNKLNASKKPLTYAGLDDDEELVFLSNNPMKIWYPKKGQHRPKGDGIKGFIESTTVNPRLAKIIELATGETDKVLVEAFIRDHNITGNEKTSVIQKEYNKFLA